MNENCKRLTQLLCTFHSGNDYRDIVGDIRKTYYLVDRKIFVFENSNEPTQIILSYNVDREYDRKLPNTISVHRKKQTNTMYSINALNCIIREENGGVLDTQFVLDWELYKNSLIITSSNGYKVINLNLIDVVKI